MPDSTSHIDIAGDLRHAEGSGAATDFNFTVARNDGAGAAAVDWWVWSDQTDAADFVGRTGGTVYFADGETSKTLTVQAAGDGAAEPDETFHISLANARGASLGVDMASAVILDDDSGSTPPPTDPPPSGGGSGAPALAISGGGQMAEGEAATFTVTRSGSPAGEAAVDWWVWGQTDGADFSGATGGTVYFHDGETSRNISLATRADGQAESDEAFHVSLANARGAALGADMADATLSDDAPTSGGGGGTGGGDGGSGDPPPAASTISVTGGGEVEEGHASTFTFSRSAASGEAAVDWWVWGQTDGADFSGPTGGTVYFHDGETAKTLTLTAVADGAAEGREDFHLTLANARGATLAADTASGSLTDPAAPSPPVAETHGAFRLSVSGSGFTEGGHVEFTVFRLNSTEGAADVDYQVAHLTTSDADFVGPISGSLHFEPGETRKTFDLIARADNINDPNERFEVHLANARGATIETGVVDKLITDRTYDLSAAPTVSIMASASIYEGEGGGLTPFVFTVVRSNPTGEASVDYALDFSPFASVDAADIGSPLSGTLHFLDGEVWQPLKVMVVADSIPEGNETLTVAMSNPQGMTFGAFSRTQMSVLSDDAPPEPATTFAMGGGPSTVDEGGELAVTVFRRGDISGAGSVSYAIGPSRPPEVYADSADFAGPTSGVVHFEPGQSGVVIHLQVLNDGVDEYTEAYHFYLYDPQGGALSGELQTSLNGHINDFVG